MYKTPWYNSIRVLIPLLLSIIIILPLITLWTINQSTLQKITRDNAGASMTSSLANKAQSVDYVLNSVLEFAAAQTSDAEIIRLTEEYLTAPDSTRHIARSRLTIELSQRISPMASIASVYLVVDGSDTVVTTIPMQKELSLSEELGKTIYDEYENGYRGRVAWSPYTAERENDLETLSYYRPVLIGDDQLPQCSLVFNVDVNALNTMLDSFAFQDTQLIVSDFKGQVMLQVGPEAPRADISDEELYSQSYQTRNKQGYYVFGEGQDSQLVAYYSSFSTSWKYLESVHLSTIYGSAQSQTVNNIIVFLLGLVAACMGAFLISRLVINPINRVLATMKKTETGDFAQVPGSVPKSEMGVMIRGYNDMVRQLSELIDRIYVQELLHQEAQLRSIQAQIDEHFLYNTINTIYCVVENRETKKAAQMLVWLARYYRLNLSAGRQYITVDDVEELISLYLWIQKARFTDRLQIDIKVDESLKGKYVLKHLFQPIVENAVGHGLEKKLGACTIKIRLKQDGGLLTFSTEDNGAGMSAEKLEEIREAVGIYSKAEGANYALKNIKEQIRLAYGEGYTIQVESKEGVGTKVSFSIPLREDANENGLHTSDR